MNGRSCRRVATPDFMLSQHFPRCERMQRENRIYRMGSDSAFAAQTTSGRFGKLRSCGSRSLPQQVIHSRVEFLHIDYYANYTRVAAKR